MKIHRVYPFVVFTAMLLGAAGYALAQTPGAVVGGQYNATPPILTDKQYGTLQLDADSGLAAYAPDVSVTGSITTQNLNMAGAATAGSAVETYLDARGSITINVSGTWTGTLTPQVTTDGTTWITPSGAILLQEATGVYTATVASGATGIYNASANGHAKFRLTASAAVTGTAVVTVRTTQPISFTTVSQVQYPTYDAAVAGLVPAAAATDIACLSAGAKRATAVHITLSGTATAATVADVVLIKRSTLNTGGTSAVATSVPRDSRSPAGTATLTTWTVNPAALGTAVGSADAQKVTLVTTAAVGPYLSDNGTITTQAYTIQGTEALCLNWNGQTIGGNNVDVHFVWTEQ